jgi:hypothetical protein
MSIFASLDSDDDRPLPHERSWVDHVSPSQVKFNAAVSAPDVRGCRVDQINEVAPRPRVGPTVRHARPNIRAPSTSRPCIDDGRMRHPHRVSVRGRTAIIRSRSTATRVRRGLLSL